MSHSSAFPYTRSDVARISGASHPQVKKLGVTVLRKRARGSGHYLGFSADDTLRIMVSRELLRIGVPVGLIHTIFKTIDTPTLPTAHPWSWLRTEEARVQGAALVLIHPHAHAAVQTGVCYLTTAVEAVTWLKSKRTVTVIDVGAFIAQLERHTGEPYA